MVLKSGENPRQSLPRHEERGPIQYSYSLEEIARASCVEYQSVRKAVSEKRVDPKNLRSVAGYIHQCLARRSKIMEEGELLPSLPENYQKWWPKRWPKFSLYRCSDPDCDKLLFSPGACSLHGGDRRPSMKLDPEGRIQLLIGDEYLPLHRLVTQSPPGFHSHHRDGNPWNNRWENLEVLTPEEHESRHVGGSIHGKVLDKQPMRKPFRSETHDRSELQEKIDLAYLRGVQHGIEQAKQGRLK